MDLDCEQFLYDGSDDLLSSLSLPSVLERDATPEEILAEAACSFIHSSDGSHSSSSDDEYKSNIAELGLLSSSPASSSSSEAAHVKWDNLYLDSIYTASPPPKVEPLPSPRQDSVCIIKDEIKTEPPPLSPQGANHIISNIPSVYTTSGVMGHHIVVSGAGTAPMTPPASPPSLVLLPRPRKAVQAKPYDKQHVAVLDSAASLMQHSNSTKKTILLSPQDFAALSKKMYSNSGSGVNKTKLVMCGGGAPAQQPVSTTLQIIPSPIIINTATAQKMVEVKKQDILQMKPIVAAPPKPSPITPASSTTSVTGGSSGEEGRSALELRAIKKHQRMIKNRESACLSRKKKKEYVTMLESKLANAEAEISRLRVENLELRSRLGQTTTVGMGGSQGKNKIILPSVKTAVGLLGGNVHKKNVALLFAMMFMVSLNIGGFGTYWLRGESAGLAAKLSRAPHHTRTLLWTLQDQDQPQSEEYLDVNNGTNCPLVNSSESERLSSALHKWAYTNLSLGPNPDQVLDYNLPHALHHHNKFIRKAKHNAAEKLEMKVSSEKPTTSEGAGALQAEVQWPDTYYLVVSRLMLPPLTLNHTHPPKVVLILPHPHHNESISKEYISVLQVECAVLDTNLLRLKADSIPDYLTNVVLPFATKTKINRKHKKATKQNTTDDEATKKAYVNATANANKWELNKIHPSIVNIKRMNNYTLSMDESQEEKNKKTFNETLPANKNNHFSFFYKTNENRNRRMLNRNSIVNNKKLNIDSFIKMERKWRGNVSTFAQKKSNEVLTHLFDKKIGV